MKKLHASSLLLLAAFCATSLNINAFAAGTGIHTCQSTASTVYSSDDIHLVGTDTASPKLKELLDSFNDLVNASNRHDLEGILKHYNPKFMSGDNLTLDQVRDMIQETWTAYPDICYDSKPIEIRMDGDWATIETQDHSAATSSPEEGLIKYAGKMTSDSRSLLFLRHVGNTWEITSDATIWEQAVIRYGLSDDVKISLSAPEQVKAGQKYTATILAQLPEGTLTIANIDNQPLTYPHPKSDEKFRAMSGDVNDLQRVMTANMTNHNEIVTATLGVTNVDQQKNPERPSLSLDGIMTIVKRVNIVPISSEDVAQSLKTQQLVETSASGKIDLSKQKDDEQSEDASPSTTEIEVVPAPSHPALPKVSPKSGQPNNNDEEEQEDK